MQDQQQQQDLKLHEVLEEMLLVNNYADGGEIMTT